MSKSLNKDALLLFLGLFIGIFTGAAGNVWSTLFFEVFIKNPNNNYETQFWVLTFFVGAVILVSVIAIFVYTIKVLGEE